MPRTAITPQVVAATGLNPVTEAANVLGNSVAQAPGRVLRVTNGSAASINVTVVTPGLVDGDLVLPDRVVAVPAAGTRYLPMQPNGLYRQPDGSANVDYSAVTTVTVAVLDAPA